MNNFKEFAKNLTKATLPIMDNREKGDIEGLIGQTVAITDYDFMPDSKGDYAVFTVKEYDGYFFFGGQVITDNLQEFDQNGYKEEIRQNGLPVKFSQKKSKSTGRSYTSTEFFPEA